MKLIGICGGSGSGKTTLAKGLNKELSPKAELISMDNYYHPLDMQKVDEQGEVNFDMPGALDLEKLALDLARLKAGHSLSLKRYGFNNPNAKEEPLVVEVKPFVLIEGIFLLADKDVHSQLDYILFVNTDIELMYQRRMARDVSERNIPEEMVNYQWNKHFMPAYKQWILPMKHLAQQEVDGNEPFDYPGLASGIRLLSRT